MYYYLLTGIAAGVASSVLYLSGSIGTSLSIFLYFLAPLPLFITGLGWGAVSAVAGTAIGVVIASFIAGLTGGLVYLVSVGFIPVVLCYYALMSRAPDDDEQTSPRTTGARDWYPLGNLILLIAGFATLLTVIFIAFVLPSTLELKNSLEVLFGALLDQNIELKTRLGGENAVPQMVAMFIALLPVTLASYTFVMATSNLWLASKIIAASGRAIRPPFDISTLHYPRLAPLVLAGILIATFLPGIIHTIALAGAASLSLAFMFLGLLVVHATVPNVPIRPLFFAMFYIAVFILFKYAYAALALIGIAETIFGIRQRFATPPPPNTPGTPPTISGR